MRRLRELHEADLLAAVQRVNTWGYPRPLEDESNSIWVSYGPDVLFWYEPMGAGDWALHLAVAPEARGRIYPRRLLLAFEILGEFLGAERLVAAAPDPQVQQYLARLGWLTHYGAQVRDLGEDEHGQTRWRSPQAGGCADADTGLRVAASGGDARAGETPPSARSGLDSADQPQCQPSGHDGLQDSHRAMRQP